MIIVSGANGQLGLELQALTKSSNQNLLFLSKHELDITDELQLRKTFENHSPKFFVNCAAYTAVDQAEDYPDASFNINASALQTIGKLCKEFDTKLIHISSDYVYHINSNSPLREFDKTNPQGVYAKSKHQGEIEVIDSGCAYIILRTSWVFSSFGKNFVKTILRFADQKKELNIVNDQIGAPTYAKDLARIILKIINLDKGWNQIYNFSNSLQCSWFDIARFIVDKKELPLVIHPIPSSQYPTAAKRPKWSVLSSEKIKNAFGIKIRTWKEALEECLELL